MSYNFYFGHFSSEAHIVFWRKCQYFGKELAEWVNCSIVATKSIFWEAKKGLVLNMFVFEIGHFFPRRPIQILPKLSVIIGFMLRIKNLPFFFVYFFIS